MLTLCAMCVQAKFKPKKRRIAELGGADSEAGKAAAMRVSGRRKTSAGQSGGGEEDVHILGDEGAVREKRQQTATEAAG